ncbi:MAG TPA: SAM hydroxide adenosyltransferase [Candidatus Saccharimonadia bacterium]|nr:SAM hydroxide adenosyltransferase [Candidatus Saccharimonadia bacterium]
MVSNVVIITDCADGNARVRQELRFEALFGVKPAFLGVGGVAPDLEAGGNLLDALDGLTNLPASRAGQEAVVLVNVAPRGDGVRRRWANGTPFCYFWVGRTLVVSTYAGRALALAAACGLVNEVEVVDLPAVVAAARHWGELTEAQAERINHTQFRSLEFLPLVAYWLTAGRSVPSEPAPVEAADVRGRVWCVDNFGNVKTTLTEDEVDFEEGREVHLADGQTAVCFRQLADVPRDTSALVIGSSGYGGTRLLEVVVQWRDGGFAGSHTAAGRHGLFVGSSVLVPAAEPVVAP